MKSNLFSSTRSRLITLVLCLFWAPNVFGEIGDAAAVTDRTGYVTVSSLHYKTVDWFTADETRIFYTLQAAKIDPEKKPVFIIFNGGPGAATTSNLFSMNTANYTLCRDFVEEGQLNKPNPFAWSDIANLIYIDPPNTGYSYNQDINSDPCEPGAADTYMSGRNFNPLVDAAQMIRAMLQILALNNLDRHKIVIVGESYGGVRATVMLHMMLFYNRSPLLKGFYKDEALKRVLQAHYDKVFDAKGQVVPPARIAKQFGYVILIQPQLTGGYHDRLTQEAFCPKDDTGLLDKIAKDKNIDGGKFLRCADFPCVRRKYRSFACLLACSPLGSDLVWSYLWMSYNNIDPYNREKPANWSDELDAFAVQSLTTATEIAKIMNLNSMADFPEMIAQRTKKSYHRGRHPQLGVLNDADSAFEPGPEYANLNRRALKFVIANQNKKDSCDGVIQNLDTYYGTPPACASGGTCCDSYYKSWDEGISLASYLYSETQPNNPIYGRMFLYDLAVLQDVMITNASNDMMIYSKTLPPSFKLFKEVSDVSVADDNNAFTIWYKPGALGKIIDTPKRRMITWPKYAGSGHAVSSTQPEKLHEDITKFLIENDLLCDPKRKERRRCGSAVVR